MGEEDMLVVVAVPVLFKHGGYLILTVIVIEKFGMRDVVIVGDSAIFRLFLVIGAHEKMGLVTMAEI